LTYKIKKKKLYYFENFTKKNYTSLENLQAIATKQYFSCKMYYHFVLKLL